METHDKELRRRRKEFAREENYSIPNSYSSFENQMSLSEFIRELMFPKNPKFIPLTKSQILDDLELLGIRPPANF